jgi:hypothetical protein
MLKIGNKISWCDDRIGKVITISHANTAKGIGQGYITSFTILWENGYIREYDHRPLQAGYIKVL